ncbi:unnamed protein product, partial [Trichogramma brassicae]
MSRNFSRSWRGRYNMRPLWVVDVARDDDDADSAEAKRQLVPRQQRTQRIFYRKELFYIFLLRIQDSSSLRCFRGCNFDERFEMSFHKARNIIASSCGKFDTEATCGIRTKPLAADTREPMLYWRERGALWANLNSTAPICAGASGIRFMLVRTYTHVRRRRRVVRGQFRIYVAPSMSSDFHRNTRGQLLYELDAAQLSGTSIIFRAHIYFYIHLGWTLTTRRRLVGASRGSVSFERSVEPARRAPTTKLVSCEKILQSKLRSAVLSCSATAVRRANFINLLQCTRQKIRAYVESYTLYREALLYVSEYSGHSRKNKKSRSDPSCVARAHPLERNEDPPPIDERDKTPEYWNAPSTVLYIALYACVWQSVSGQRLGDRENSENSASPTRL